MPQLYRHRSQQYSVFENLKVFFEHGWHFRVLFMERTPRGELHPDLFPAHPLVYLIVSCLWEENLRDLDKEIKRISFKEIRNPKLEINAKLHDRREDLARIKEGLTETAMYVPKQVKTYFATYSEGTLDSRINQQNWDRLIEKAAKLDAFLMETFQLFMSSVSVQDSHLSIEQSRLSIEQAQRGSQLTFLAFIYVPLSFITGIFGMNVQQINSSGLNIWVCFVVLVPVIVITLLLFLAVKCYGHRKDAARKLTDHSEV
jgi:Mg2+ and Co2+ transporter CorA